MSLSRVGEDAEYFGKRPPGYVYIQKGKLHDYRFNTPIRDPTQFCELAMRSLAQSGELSDNELKKCEAAFRERFSGLIEESEGR
jgi:hypothetical protein